ncbi:hypothetical protein HRG_002461 [Hirsutella rhossiliensis]|uniref:Uncharacterized protein n=1 Tax=Hirsutella rhossiliensis TaxID=111463 RepID=A0A9P8N4Y9_9HYPO|nr:uncharacterized protein HRG_02461 [Hirsutella rhossiliensis]KAH0967052.1 hypothetical protein HRG_02461 [Hirsutella rhossiliensis]
MVDLVQRRLPEARREKSNRVSMRAPLLPDFGSASELLKQQKDLAEEEKAKCCSRLDAADEKLQMAVQQLVGRLPQPKPDDIARPQSEHKPSERPATDLESRLSAAQKSAEASFAKMLADESSMIKESLRTEFDAQTAELRAQAAELKAQLVIEKIRNETLKKDMKALEHRVDDSAKDDPRADSQKPGQGSQIHATSETRRAAAPEAKAAEMQAEKALALATKIKEETRDLVSRNELDEALRKLDKTMSLPEDGSEDDELHDPWPVPGEGTALKLRALASKLRNLESSVGEQDVKQMALHIQTLKTEVDGHAEAIKQQADQQLEAKSAIQTLKTETDGHAEAIKQQADQQLEAKSAIQTLKTETDGHAEAIKQQADQQLEAKSAIQTMEFSLAKLSASQLTESPAEMREGVQGAVSNEASADVSEVAPANASDSHIQQISRAEVESVLRDFLPTISSKLADFLKEEKVKRESVAKEGEKTADAAAALRVDLDNLKQECIRSLQELAHQFSKVNSDVVSSKHRLEILETTCPASRAETKSELDELAMQVRDVHSWQNNFTTRPLYKDIVDHINATLPNGVLNQLKGLAARVAGIEGYLHAAEGGDAKKRKVQATLPTAPNVDQQGYDEGTV